jgi:hypothetical protein
MPGFQLPNVQMPNVQMPDLPNVRMPQMPLSWQAPMPQVQQPQMPSVRMPQMPGVRTGVRHPGLLGDDLPLPNPGFIGNVQIPGDIGGGGDDAQPMGVPDLVRMLGLKAIDKGAQALGFPGDVEKLLGIGHRSMNEEAPFGLGRAIGQWGQRVFPDYFDALQQVRPLAQYLPAGSGQRTPAERFGGDQGADWFLQGTPADWRAQTVGSGLPPSGPQRFLPAGPNSRQTPTTYADWQALTQPQGILGQLNFKR